MNHSKLFAALLSILFLITLTTAYTASGNVGSTIPTTACNDNTDNDGDGFVDENDPGCAQPYHSDDSEANVYDLDASWVFSGGSVPSQLGPSAYYGWHAQNTDGVIRGDRRGTTTGNIEEAYVNNSDSTWGGEQINYAEIGFSGAGYTNVINSYWELVDTPGSTTGETCGDGRRSSGENNFDCPEDMGLPDDFSNSNGGTTSRSNKHVSETFTDNLGSGIWDADNVVQIGDQDNSANNGEYLNSKNNNDDTQDHIWYDFDPSSEGMTAPEAQGNKNHDITGSETSDQVIQDQRWDDVPDFYLKDTTSDGITNPDEIWMVYPIKTGETTIGTKTDYDLTGSKTVEKWGDMNTATTCSGANCSEGYDMCTSIDHGTDTSYELEDSVTETVRTSQNEEYYAYPSGDFGHAKGSDNLPDLSVDVTFDPGYTTESVDDDECGGTTTTGSCTSSIGCSEGSVTTVGEVSSQTIKTGYTSDDITYRFEDLELRTAKIFDLNPNEDVAGNGLPSGKQVLFEGDSFKPSNEDYSSAVVRNSVNGDAFWSYEKTRDNKEQGNDIAVSNNNFHLDTNGNYFFSRRTDYNTFDADGPNGQGDGFVAISDGTIVGSTNRFLATEEKNGADVDFVTQSSYYSNSDVPVSCPSGYDKCVASVDVSLDNLDQWGNPLYGSSGLNFQYATGQPQPLDASLGVCMMYRRLSGDSQVNCQYDNDDSDGGGGGDPPTPGGACGDEPSEYWAYMEGPEINENVLDSKPSHYEGCIDTSQPDISRSACIYNGNAVPEGRVVNVADTTMGNDYERGGNSPDWEVCLDLEGTGINTRSTTEGDERSGDNVNNDLNQEDNGGEWYDLDSEAAQEYLRGVRDGAYSTASGRSLVSDSSNINSDGRTGYGTEDIDWYWRENSNPYDADYNPEGNTFGTALEDDCGNSRFDNIECNDAGNVNDKEPMVYSFFTDRKRDDDFQAQGINGSGTSYFNGYINKLEENSNQLETSMDTDAYYTSTTPSPSIWNNSDGSQNAADQWAITKEMNWSISSRGVPYPPYGVYHRTGGKRTDPQNPTVVKSEMAFGNSYAAVDSTNDGVWIDPDDIKSDFSSYVWNLPSWKEVIRDSYGMDITGPDAGLGVDKGDGSSLEFYQSPSGANGIVYGDIYYEGEPSTAEATISNTDGSLEPPVCGDDQREFLLEERGEVKNSENYNGRYACSDAVDRCVQRDYSGQKLYSTGTYLQANEDAESRGRLKQDEEYCAKMPSGRFSGYDGDDFPNWYDQDFGDIDGDGTQDTCETNNLYGALGKRWFTETDVEEHPNAFTGGIDDDSNKKLEDEGLSNLVSRPEQSSWSSSETPVSSGELDSPSDRNVSTKGFCGGDDKSEYIVTQRCETRYCETNNSVIGVAEDPDHCILDQDQVDGVSGTNRDLYDQGDTLDVNTGSDTKTIACYGGEWHEEWPVVFLRDSTNVPLGTTDRVSFQVINVEDDSGTFDLELSIGNSNLDALTTFQQTGTNELTVEVPASSSETYNVEIRGNTIVDPSQQIELQAESRDGSLQGFDTIQASITNSTSSTVGNTTQQTRDVPGIGMVQIIWLVMMASAIYFFSARNW